MKRFLIILFTFFYFTATSGVTVHMHYCMNELVKVNFGQTEKENCRKCSSAEATKADKCNKCGNKKVTSKDCCQDKQGQLKIEKNQQASQSLYKIGDFHAITLFHYPGTFQNLFISSNEKVGLPLNNAPPLKGSVSTFILNCTFRI